MTSQSSYRIFLDMDGVICDFDTQLKEHMGIPQETDLQEYIVKNKAKNKMWYHIRKTNGLFWSTMPPLFDNVVDIVSELQNYTEELHILSRPDKNDLDTCIKGKNEWLDKHLGPELVPHHRRFFEQDKSIYATPKSILIDDSEENIDAWISKGGIGLLFSGSFDEIFQQLREL